MITSTKAPEARKGITLVLFSGLFWTLTSLTFCTPAQNVSNIKLSIRSAKMVRNSSNSLKAVDYDLILGTCFCIKQLKFWLKTVKRFCSWVVVNVSDHSICQNNQDCHLSLFLLPRPPHSHTVHMASVIAHSGLCRAIWHTCVMTDLSSTYQLWLAQDNKKKKQPF